MTKTLNINWLFALTTILTLFVLFYYILQVGALSKDLHLLEDYQKKLSTLSDGNNHLDINFAKANSLSNIEDYLANGDFIKPEKISYIQILEGSVVTKPR